MNRWLSCSLRGAAAASTSWDEGALKRLPKPGGIVEVQFARVFRPLESNKAGTRRDGRAGKPLHDRVAAPVGLYHSVDRRQFGQQRCVAILVPVRGARQTEGRELM